jgi:tetratricopeptide (TPR) repeat protein
MGQDATAAAAVRTRGRGIASNASDTHHPGLADQPIVAMADTTQAATAKSPDTAAKTETPADAFACAEAHYRAGAFTEAAAIVSALTAANPADAPSFALLGLCELRLGAPSRAMVLLERAQEMAPADPHIRLRYGLALHAVGRHQDAAAQFRACAPLLAADPAPYLNLSAALLALGDAAGSLDAARRARRRAPNLAEASYMVGLACLNDERLDAAEEAFTHALRLAPGLADAWINLGIVRYRRGDLDSAKNAMRRALAAAPGNPTAATNLATFLRLTGQVEESERLLDEVLARFPDADAARVNQAAVLLTEERPAEALALLDARPAPVDPSLARHWRMQRSLALLQTGRASEARAELGGVGAVPREVAPLALWRRVLLALAEGDEATACAHALAMGEALAKDAAFLPEHRLMAHFDLARFWSGQRDPDAAFAHWSAGHRLLGGFQPFSRDRHRAFVDASIAKLDRLRLADGARANNGDPTPVFIVGMPRTGTTLAEQIIAAHPQAIGAGERSVMSQAITALGGETPETIARIAGLDQATLDGNAERYLEDLHALAPDKARIVDKMPGNFLYLGLVALLLPGARIIHCVRDPRDVGLSIFTFRFYGYHPYAHDLGDLGWYIAEHDRLMAHWRNALPNPVLTLPLQDWIADFDATLNRVLEFLDLPYDPACARFYQQGTRVRTVSRAQVRQPINARGLGRWRTYARQLQPLIAELERAGALPAG